MAPPAVTFSWLCQLKAAPYSYDWLDNYGRRSPRKLDPVLQELTVNERFMSIFRLTSFTFNEHVTIRISSHRARRLFGDLAVTYRVLPQGVRSRILVKMVSEDRGALWYWILAFGDLIMMRKQLLTLKDLAEAESTKEKSF